MLNPTEYGLQQYSTSPPPPSHTLSVYIVLWHREGGGGWTREKVSSRATVYKAGTKIPLWLNMSQVYKLWKNTCRKVPLKVNLFRWWHRIDFTLHYSQTPLQLRIANGKRILILQPFFYILILVLTTVLKNMIRLAFNLQNYSHFITHIWSFCWKEFYCSKKWAILPINSFLSPFLSLLLSKHSNRSKFYMSPFSKLPEVNGVLHAFFPSFTIFVCSALLRFCSLLKGLK
jgi:hypothetical protein